MHNHKYKVLLVEDDINLGFLLVEYMEPRNFDVKLYKDGESGFKGFMHGQFDICVLDVMLPNLDGFSLARKIKSENKNIPIIFLTAKSLKEDKIKGFNIGADDYITKPFDEDELICRIYAVLNRVNPQKDMPDCFDIGKFKFDTRSQILSIHNKKKRLTLKESEILKVLCMSMNTIVIRDQILSSVWGKNDYFTGRSMDVFMTKLRKYLNDDQEVKIDSIPGIGYMLIG